MSESYPLIEPYWFESYVRVHHYRTVEKHYP